MPHQRWSGKVLLLSLLTLLGNAGAVTAQPSFTLFDRKPVARGPIFATTGQFDPSTPRGVAVTSFWVDQVTVFPLPVSGGLGAALSLDVGRNLRNILSFDVDGDSTDDLIVVDEAGGARDARLFSMLRGAGGFQSPEEVVIAASSVETIRRGNFDGIGPPDLATANGGAGTVSLVYGTATGLVAGNNIFLAGAATDVAAIDLDGDGLDDLAVLSERDEGASVVTTLRSAGPGFTPFGPVTELDVVGVRMVTGHFDDDGILDLAVVAGGPSLTEYRSRTLLTQRPAPGSSEPSFLIEGQTFTCPADSRGTPTRCQLHDAVSADFDRDGRDDLALSMPNPGVITVLWRGPTVFEGPLLVGVIGSPRGIAAGDVTGDGVDDLVITEFDEDMITVMRSVPPPGDGCLGDCNQDGVVTVDEILLLLQIALGTAQLHVCPAADGSGDGLITVDEIVGAVDVALDGC